MIQPPENLYTTFDQCIKNKISPLLKEKGFRKKRYVWNRRRCNFVDVIDFQISGKCSNSNFIAFTMNFGVCVPESITKIFDTIKAGEKDFIGEVNCIVRARPGDLNLNPEIIGRDRWWDVTSKAEIEKAFEEIEELLKIKALPFIDYFDSLEKIGEFMIKKHKKLALDYYELIQLGIVLFMAGREIEAREILMEVINTKKRWGEKASLVAQKLGLTI